jgi:hypothetical protein
MTGSYAAARWGKRSHARIATPGISGTIPSAKPIGTFGRMPDKGKYKQYE